MATAKKNPAGKGLKKPAAKKSDRMTALLMAVTRKTLSPTMLLCQECRMTS